MKHTPTHKTETGRPYSYSAEEFAKRISKVMLGLSSSHVFFIVQEAYGDIDWTEVERICKAVQQETSKVRVNQIKRRR